VEGVKDYAIFMLDPDGFVVSWNTGAEEIKGYRPDEIIGQHFSRFYPPDKVAQRWPEHELEMAKRDGRFEDEGWRVRKDGSTFWANVIITALRDAAGTLHGFSKVTRDLTERRRNEQSLRDSEERFRLLVQGVKDYAIFMLDPDGFVVSWNAGAEAIKGYRADEIIGQHFSRFYDPDIVAQGWPAHELEMAKKEGRFEDEGWRVRKDGSTFWASVVITALHDRTGRLRGFAKITRDLTTRKRVEALEEAEVRTQAFLAMLAHELRNPLAPIRNALGVLQMTPQNDSITLWSREVIERQVTHLTRLVDDLLDMSRITSNKITLKREPVELAELTRDALEVTRPLIESREHTLEVRAEAEPLWVEGDPTRLSQVVLNLLNNSAKYTPPGGRIWLTVEREDGQAVLRVRDTGVGIPADLLPKVFDLFVQGERTLDRSEGGLGIGLTLVRQLVQLHGGSVQALSPGPGRGTELVVRLPLLAGESLAALPSQSRETGGSPQVRPRRILIVDDNSDATQTLLVLLELWGHEVRSAHDGPAALAAAAELQPEIVLLDLGLPGMSGFEVAPELRALPGLRDVTIVAVTGYGQDEDRRKTREAGFDHHLVKPVDPDLLRKLIAGRQPVGI
ncbi:MAG TPA: PAS domain S-box protein, partial [Thermoanaerobaculia bacterium]|nr:PAS domain S-box protein [Thermoanaerobaculia bacterium]